MTQKFSYLNEKEEIQFIERLSSDSDYALNTTEILDKIGTFISRSFPFNAHRYNINQEQIEIIEIFKQVDYFQLKAMLHLFSSDYQLFNSQGEIVNSELDNTKPEIINVIKSYNYDEFFLLLNDMKSYIEKEIFDRFSIANNTNQKNSNKL
jgi:hypothetical protein